MNHIKLTPLSLYNVIFFFLFCVVYVILIIGISLPDYYKNSTYLLINNGNQDGMVKEEPQRYHNALEANGVHHTFYTLDGGQITYTTEKEYPVLYCPWVAGSH